MNKYNLRPIQDIIEKVKDEMRDQFRQARERCAERIASIEKHRLVIPMLDAEGVPMKFHSWDDQSSLDIDLGLRPESRRGKAEFARQLVAIRRILGRLRMTGQDVGDHRKRLVQVSLGSHDYPRVRIRYTTRLPKGAKCKIVTKRRSYVTSSLVCDVPSA